jgi:hypothetical protein
MEESNANPDVGVDTDTNSDDTNASSSPSRKMVLGGAIAVFGVITTGLLVYVLERIGPAGSGELVWILGYGLTIFTLWYLLLRPIDLTGR